MPCKKEVEEVEKYIRPVFIRFLAAGKEESINKETSEIVEDNKKLKISFEKFIVSDFKV